MSGIAFSSDDQVLAFSPFAPTSSRAIRTAPQMPSCARSRRETRPPASKGSSSEDAARIRRDPRAGRARLRAGRLRSEKAVSLGKPGSGAATTTAPEQAGTQRSNVSLEVWFSRDKGLVAVRRAHAPTQLVATAAMNALLEGPTAAERSAGLRAPCPPGTRLLGIAIHDGLATVDLTSEYQSGGGAPSMQTRLGQVVYTLTQFPTVEKVRFRLDGEPVNVFSSEGIVLKKPGRPERLRRPAAGDHGRQAGGRRARHEPGDRLRERERVRGERDRRGARRQRQGGRQDVHHRQLRHRLPRHVLRGRDLQGRAGAGRHDRRARRRRGRNRHAAALGADPGHARREPAVELGSRASSSREVSPHAPSSSSAPVLRSKRGSARPTTSVAGEQRQDVVAVLALRLRDVHLEPVAKAPEGLRPVAVLDEAVERRQHRHAVRDRLVGDVRVCMPLAALQPDAERAKRRRARARARPRATSASRSRARRARAEIPEPVRADAPGDPDLAAPRQDLHHQPQLPVAPPAVALGVGSGSYFRSRESSGPLRSISRRT